MRVYVINQRKEPLMPTTPCKARKLLKQGKVKVVKREPFTIQLLYATGETKQDITLGVDAGSKIIGLSATTDKQELFSAEVELRNDIVDLLSTRREFRRTRRNRLRYRKPRFLNRVYSKNKGWLAPSVENKIQTHLKIISKIHEILPISKIIIEVASFDIQKIKNPDIEGKQYQQGEQLGFWNVREYVLWRDGYKCQGKKGCKNKILNVHHIESRKTGGNSPSNLITLCESCHKDYHAGKLKLNLKRGQSFKDAAFMGIMRWTFYNKLKEIYSNVKITYGYITKNTRIQNNLPKEHRIDALCISGNPNVKRLDYWYYIKQVRRHNRQIHKANILKGGKKKLNQAPYLVKGFRLFDKVKYKGEECFIFGRRSSGYFDLRKLDGTVIHRSANCKDLKLISKSKTLLWERRIDVAVSSHD
ncbi:RNA-guided endonuclease IscB [Acetivibrio straminisolvens]|uniref:RNA-guided endonuclease IscB n=1 Tax=Acetivibrio straminisolvens TaxID=253314 RepID=UPI00223FC3FA|nr:RNA-guided endonuclease IscB [Acetivibrio straminisolvens]